MSIKFDKRNYRKHGARNKELIRKSLSDLGAGRSVLIDADDSLIAGNGVYEQAQKLGIPVRVVETDGTELIAVKRTDVHEEDEKRKMLAFADNATSDSSEFDMELLATDFQPMELAEWDVSLPDLQEDEESEIERKRREFAEKMAAGELDEDNPEYQEFLAKFEAKKTTDDCYTPEPVYEAVADWVANEYKVSRANFVRPFYPGGDYQREKYKKTDIVVDNPPFSILSQILDWYNEHGVKYFLFCSHLTQLGTAAGRCSALCVDVCVTYANGANVSTSFCTNLEPKDIVLRSVPTLYKAVKEANDKNLKQMHKELPKYSYPMQLLQSPAVARFSRYGIDFVAKVGEVAPISALDSQKAEGKSIYGKGYLMSERLTAEREKAEREKAEREKAEREKAMTWKLSDREIEIIKKLK